MESAPTGITTPQATLVAVLVPPLLFSVSAAAVADADAVLEYLAWVGLTVPAVTVLPTT